MASSSSPPPSLSPSTGDFEVTLTSHIDESKPDPLARRQIENLILHWESSQTEEQEESNEADAETKHLCGTLTLYGDYMAVTINSDCSWTWGPCAENTDSCAAASLSFRLAASAKFIPQSQHKRLQKERLKRRRTRTFVPEKDSKCSNEDDQSPKVDRKEQRAQTKIRAGMIDRLQKDYYIKRFLLAPLDGDSKSDQTQLQHIICEAEIKESFGPDGEIKELEERVDVSEDVLEGIRKAILSHLDENTSMLDLLLSFPYLLNTDIETRKDGKGNGISLQLGHRAVLRLLEDACIDACEKEGEDELLDDLQISARSGKGGDSSAESTCSEGRCAGQAASQRKKRSKR